MKNVIYLILFLCSFQSFSQQERRDSLFVLYKGNTELIKKSTSKISKTSGFRILMDIYKNKKYRDSIAKAYWKRGGQVVPFYIGFTGEKNFVLKSIDNINLNTVEDISKFNINMGYGQLVFFIEKLDCNLYKFHQTHKTYD